jgi:hypothetical protein
MLVLRKDDDDEDEPSTRADIQCNFIMFRKMYNALAWYKKKEAGRIVTLQNGE